MSNSKNSSVSDEKLILALVEKGGVAAAANSVGLSNSAVYQRLKNPDFRYRFETVTNGLISAISTELTINVSSAIQTLSELAKDEKQSGQTRLLAADKLLSHCQKFAELSRLRRRADESEAQELKLDFFGGYFGGNDYED